MERIWERNAESVQVAHRADHRQHAAGEHAVLAAYDTVANLDGHVAQAVRAVAEPGPGHRVGHERDPPGSRLPDESGGVIREVDTVEDDLDDDVGPGEGSAG